MCGQVGRFKPHWAGHMLRMKGSHHPEQRGIFLFIYSMDILQMSVYALQKGFYTVHVSLHVTITMHLMLGSIILERAEFMLFFDGYYWSWRFSTVLCSHVYTGLSQCYQL